MGRVIKRESSMTVNCLKNWKCKDLLEDDCRVKELKA